MKLGRIDLQELTRRRVWEAILRRLSALPDIAAWKSNNKLHERISRLHNYHLGKTAVVVANGPSLLKTDLSKLQDVPTIIMNRAYMMLDRWPFRPNYLVCINELVLEQFSDDFAKLDVPKIFNWNRRHLFINDSKAMYVALRLSGRDQFGKDLTKLIWSGGTVTFVSLQFAYYLGFQKVVLVGLDHSFSDKGTPNRTEVRRSSVDHNHFHPEYFPKGIKWQLPDLLRSERAYEIARETYERDGRIIVDATVGGLCEVFPKQSLDDALL